MKRYKLDKEEKQILRDFNAGKFVQVENFEEEKKRLMEAARNTLRLMKKPQAKLTVKLSGLDMESLKQKAKKTGMSYQALATSVLQKFANKQESA